MGELYFAIIKDRSINWEWPDAEIPDIVIGLIGVFAVMTLYFLLKGEFPPNYIILTNAMSGVMGYFLFRVLACGFSIETEIKFKITSQKSWWGWEGIG